MRNRDLANDSVSRAASRVQPLDVLCKHRSRAEVVREAQEAVELALEGLLRAHGVEPPRIHAVSDVLLTERARLPEARQSEVEGLAAISRDLRRDRELAFYGAEDLTPSGFCSKQDAVRARDGARHVVAAVRPHVPG